MSSHYIVIFICLLSVCYSSKLGGIHGRKLQKVKTGDGSGKFTLKELKILNEMSDVLLKSLRKNDKQGELHILPGKYFFINISCCMNHAWFCVEARVHTLEKEIRERRLHEKHKEHFKSQVVKNQKRNITRKFI